MAGSGTRRPMGGLPTGMIGVGSTRLAGGTKKKQPDGPRVASATLPGMIKIGDTLRTKGGTKGKPTIGPKDVASSLPGTIVISDKPKRKKP